MLEVFGGLVLFVIVYGVISGIWIHLANRP